jgi:hypothetical protein
MRVLGAAAFSIAFLACETAPPKAAAVSRHRSFDEEARDVYGVTPPLLNEGEISRARAELERLLPGEGPLFSRYAEFQRRFLIPPEKLPEAIDRALEESRRRTRERIELPAREAVQVESVSGAPWPSFARYLGDSRSVVQINRDYPLTPGDLLEIACHEAYPGHHVLNVLREKLEPPEGREAFLHEGLASYAVELAFPGDERLRFEKDVLFPVAGLDPEKAELVSRVAREVRRLAPLRVEAARAYLERRRDRVQSVLFLENEALVPAPWAFLQFVDRYRTYVVAYTAGPEEVGRRIEASASDPWKEYVRILMEGSNEI